MKRCLTRQLLYAEVSGCLVEKPECGYAYKLGYSFLCRHPEHAAFNAFDTRILTKQEMDELYGELRQKRRDEFMVHQVEAVRKSLCIHTGFYNQNEQG